MAKQSNVAPVIIKRKKIVAAQGHHGGAWKVAYADFVTAMMAFFLLMWLLNATTEKQRKGLSDYFNPTIAVNRISGGGDGVLGGETMFSDETRIQNGTGGRADQQPEIIPSDATEAQEAEAIEKLIEQALLDRGEESRSIDQLMRHVITRVTDEGLVIELFDLPGIPLFEGDGVLPRPVMAELAALLAEVLNLTRNRIGIAGHLAGNLAASRVDSGWQLSTDRAQSIRSMLQKAGVDQARMQRVTGHSDRNPAVRDSAALRNNRIEIILLRRDR